MSVYPIHTIKNYRFEKIKLCVGSFTGWGGKYFPLE